MKPMSHITDFTLNTLFYFSFWHEKSGRWPTETRSFIFSLASLSSHVLRTNTSIDRNDVPSILQFGITVPNGSIDDDNATGVQSQRSSPSPIVVSMTS